MSPTAKSSVLAPSTTHTSVDSFTKAGSVAMTATKMATPPIIAVALRCQRSFRGIATAPKRRASARTIGVAAAAAANAIRAITVAERGKALGIRSEGVSYSMQAAIASERIRFCVRRKTLPSRVVPDHALQDAVQRRLRPESDQRVNL